MLNHKTKDGRIIPLDELELDHLKNIIKFIERKAKEGFIIAVGGDYWDTKYIWYDEIFYQGDEALEYLNYKDYVDELKRREKDLLFFDKDRIQVQIKKIKIEWKY